MSRRLAGRYIDAIYSSDLERARQTASAIVRGRETEIIYDRNLRERCYGIFEGKNVSSFNVAFQASGLTRDAFQPPGGESYHDVRARCETFIRQLHGRIKNPDETVLLVSHSGTNRILLGTLLKKNLDAAVQFEQENTCLNEFTVNEDIVTVLRLNCTEHLEGEEYSRLGQGE